MRGWLVSRPETLLHHLSVCGLVSSDVKQRAAVDYEPRSRKRGNNEQSDLNLSTEAWTQPQMQPPYIGNTAIPHTSLPSLHPLYENPLYSPASGSGSGYLSVPSMSGLPSPLIMPTSTSSSLFQHSPAFGSYTPSQLSPLNTNIRQLSNSPFPSSSFPSGASTTQLPSSSASSLNKRPRVLSTISRSSSLSARRSGSIAEQSWDSGRQQRFESGLMRITASAGLPLGWQENPEFFAFIEEFVSQEATIPSRRVMTQRVLPQTLKQCRDDAILRIHKLGTTDATLQFDEWAGINKQHLDAFVITVSRLVRSLVSSKV